ncbi:aryl-sulfate sulfotransferase [Changchengzhania lutea]|uniref:aryl-sulfate sulfotransferase n=1 Tax=Changchengzhania lutea TaxID=2049305 RepID=UPI00115E2BDC|nr:aryl-sulfate sulfotransferase [Changchengzhania lutea]
MKRYYVLSVLIFVFTGLFGQNTVGVISNSTDAYNGYTLFTSHESTYLINNCGEIINEWTSNYIDGKSVYLLEDGSILRAGFINNLDLTIAGIGGIVEKINWDGDVVWDYTYSSSTYAQHHDIYPLPNGNILILAVTKKTVAEATQAGRDPLLLEDDALYNEQIIEVQPDLINGGGSIVWEWNVWDHLIQDFDTTKDNFGVVANNPQLIDINYLGSSGKKANWLHFNSIQYNHALNQIIISARQLNEIYIIDHSTTTLQASMHTGGNRNKGGDILYRWGNPIVYKKGLEEDQKLFGPHTPHWIPDSYNDGGKILIFNNGFGKEPEFSTVDIINPEIDLNGNYIYTGDPYGPIALDWTYQNENPTDFFSRIMSSAQRLPNGSALICDADSGYFFELDTSKNKVWEYINPLKNNGEILNQGDAPVANRTFRAFKYSNEYVAFIGKDLTPGNPIELNSNLNEPCSTLSNDKIEQNKISINPNPVNSYLTINTPYNLDRIDIYNAHGLKCTSKFNTKSLDFSNYASGIYFVKMIHNNSVITKKIIKN